MLSVSEPVNCYGYIFIDHRQESFCLYDTLTVGEYLIWGDHWRWNEDGRQIGYRIFPHFHNRGLMTEALPLILKMVPREYHRLIIKPWNIASMRVAEKCGFKEYVGLDTRETYWRLV